jgi:hypothetical protein
MQDMRKFKRVIMSTMILALGMGVVPAGADSTARMADTIIDSCIFSGGISQCIQQQRHSGGGIPRIISVRNVGEPLHADTERDRKWAERCQPQLRRDAYGIGRYVYAARGCEYGRAED